ncbi:unnamed protein product [Lathyrus sativus]|nr:unnamed protein product [Lathyrus sativus]
MYSSKGEEARKHPIIKLSYPQKRRSDVDDSEEDSHKRRKPIVTSRWAEVKKEESKISSNDEAVDLGCKKMIKNSDDPRESLKKKPMERYKRMQCWVILKRMIEGRDGWALNEALDLKGSESDDNKLIHSIGLKDIEAKLRLYSTPDEFANDMRLVFSNAFMLHSSRDHVFNIATRFSDEFERRWKSLKKEWALEKTRVNKIHQRKITKEK